VDDEAFVIDGVEQNGPLRVIVSWKLLTIRFEGPSKTYSMLRIEGYSAKT